jgi:hypothetical protein
MLVQHPEPLSSARRQFHIRAATAGAIDKFVSAYSGNAAPFEWTKAVVHPTAPKRVYSE